MEAAEAPTVQQADEGSESEGAVEAEVCWRVALCALFLRHACGGGVGGLQTQDVKNVQVHFDPMFIVCTCLKGPRHHHWWGGRHLVVAQSWERCWQAAGAPPLLPGG